MSMLRLVGPSVSSLLSKHNLLSVADSIKATGPKGNLVKSDILAFLCGPKAKSLKFYCKRANVNSLITYSLNSGKSMETLLQETARKISFSLLKSDNIEIVRSGQIMNIFGGRQSFSFHDYSKSFLEPEVYSLGQASAILVVSRTGDRSRVVGFDWFGDQVQEWSELSFDLAVDGKKILDVSEAWSVVDRVIEEPSLLNKD